MEDQLLKSNTIDVTDLQKVVYSPAHIALQDIQDLIIDGWRIGKDSYDICVLGFNVLRVTMYKSVSDEGEGEEKIEDECKDKGEEKLETKTPKTQRTPRNRKASEVKE